MKKLLFLLALPLALHAQDGQPKLFEPYAPKPSGTTPDGWEIRILEGSQVENSTVLKNKREIKVTVPAYELVPATKDGKITIIKDPGFESKLANAQKNTVGAVLTQFSETAGGLQEKLDKIIQEMEKGIGPDIKEEKPAEKQPEAKPQEKTTEKPIETKESSNAKKKPNTPTR